MPLRLHALASAVLLVAPATGQDSSWVNPDLPGDQFVYSNAAPQPENTGPLKNFGTAKSGFTLPADVEMDVFNHTLPIEENPCGTCPSKQFGVLTHFWVTCTYLESPFTKALHNLYNKDPLTGNCSDNVTVRFYVDGEKQSSIAFKPPLAAGVGFDDHGVGGNAKGGHGSSGGGWYINHKVPFSSSIRVTLELPGVGPPADPEDRLRGAASTFVIVRGTENLPVMVGTITLPRNARLELEKIEDKTFKPGEYVPIVNRDKGHGLIYMTAIQANSTNSDFIQGCYHLYTPHSAKFPGLVLSTGMEEFFDSAYDFAGVPRDGSPGYGPHHPTAGITHKNTSTDDGGMAVSAYRYHSETDPLVFNGGVKMVLRVGDYGNAKTHPESPKCYIDKPGRDDAFVGNPKETTVTSYAWVYTFPPTPPDCVPCNADVPFNPIPDNPVILPWTSPPSPAPSAQVFDDPHVRTISGNQYFMHGVGVFDYASVPGVMKTQVYMCPTAQCSPEMMVSGDCLTFIYAVAIKIEDPHPSQTHSVILRNNWLKVDHVDRRDELNITLGKQTTVSASGLGTADDDTHRVMHESLADCHVLDAFGQLVPNPNESGAIQTKRLMPEYSVSPDASPAPSPAPSPSPSPAPLREARRKKGGVWQECTRNEWTVATPGMTLDVGVIGPFEEGFLREDVSTRTFNINVDRATVKDVESLQGIINGDKNGLFQLDPRYNDLTAPLVPGALVPEGPHGFVQEVTAPNVAQEDVIFPPENLQVMDQVCGAAQPLRAMRMADGTATSDDLARGWKNWKSMSPGVWKRMP